MTGKEENLCSCGCGGTAGHDVADEPLLRLIKTAWSDAELKLLEKKIYVEGFMETRAGKIPRVSSEIRSADIWGTIKARLGIGRDNYAVMPGLYAFGSPDEASPLIATCNYKLTFDHLRETWKGLSLWVLALDTKGINVWCAAGKGTFGTDELIRRLEYSKAKNIVAKAEIILPQLGAGGVSAHEVKKASGFKVYYGPIKAADFGEYLAAGKVADSGMREVTFTLWERAVLIPVELSIILPHLKWVLPAVLALSGLNGFSWSPASAWARGGYLLFMLLSGVFAGSVAVPILLNLIPGKAFAMKGFITGGLAALSVALWGSSGIIFLDMTGAGLLAAAVSSFAAMNFTGATPFTSPTGVEREMRRYMPLQIAAAVAGLGLFIAGGFGAGR